jgi:hypothetical protein
MSKFHLTKKTSGIKNHQNSRGSKHFYFNFYNHYDIQTTTSESIYIYMFTILFLGDFSTGGNLFILDLSFTMHL